MYQAVVAKVQNIRPLPKADRLNLATVEGVQVIISKDVKEDTLGIFFADDGCLSQEMCFHNNLFSHPELNKDKTKKGYFRNDGRVMAQMLRGERSYGFWTEFSTFSWTKVDPSTLVEGFTFTVLNGHEICRKYFNPATLKKAQGSGPSKAQKIKDHIKNRYGLLKEHFDTAQLRREIKSITAGSILYLSLKMHGTSQRTGNIPVQVLSRFETLWNHYMGWTKRTFVPHMEYQIVSGTRRTVMNPSNHTDGYYKDTSFREIIHNQIKSLKLDKGLTLYYEVVGYTDTNAPIMGRHSIDKIDDKKLKKQVSQLYGDTITYSYDCLPESNKKFDIYVYRITSINEDGIVRDLSWPQVTNVCNQLNLKTVPLFQPGFIYQGSTEDLLSQVESYLDNPDPIGKTHPTEGVCVRVETPTGETYILKDKSFLFKVLEQLIKSDPNAIDLEEAEELQKSEG